MNNRSKLVKMRIENIGCIGAEGLTIELDDIHPLSVQQKTIFIRWLRTAAGRYRRTHEAPHDIIPRVFPSAFHGIRPGHPHVARLQRTAGRRGQQPDTETGVAHGRQICRTKRLRGVACPLSGDRV
jgi:hypothetical protein